MSEYTPEEKAEAFAAWDAYKPRFVESIAGVIRIPGAGQTLIDNPLVMIIYADAYLAGRRAATPIPPAPICEHEGCTNPGEDCYHPDARFIAASPADVRDLLAEVDRLGAALDAANERARLLLEAKGLWLERTMDARRALANLTTTPWSGCVLAVDDWRCVYCGAACRLAQSTPPTHEAWCPLVEARAALAAEEVPSAV